MSDRRASDTVHHTAIQVKDIARAVTWYTAQFNCQVTYQDDTWAMLQFANTAIALVLPGQHPYHFAIISEDLSPYGAAVAHRDGTQSVYMKDPDGNTVEMLKLAEDDANT